MRILILATDIYTRGGIGRYTYDMAKLFRDIAGPESIDVAAFFNWGKPPEAPQPFRLLSLAGESAAVGTRLRFIRETIAGYLRNGPYDLIFCNHVVMAPFAALLGARRRTPYWVACHSTEVWWNMPPWQDAALRRADLVLPVSQFTATVLVERQRLRPERVVLLMPVLSDEWVAQLSSGASDSAHGDGLTLLSVASMARGFEYKGMDTVLRALPDLLKDFPTLRYAIVGGGPDRARLETLAATLGVAGAVRFTGEIDEAELAAEFRGCDVFVLPSRGQTHAGQWGGEGFGRVYIEAACASRPVVGSRTGGSAEAVHDGVNGMLVDPARPEAVGAALRELLADPARRAAMGAAGPGWFAANFSETIIRGRLRDLMRQQGLTI